MKTLFAAFAALALAATVAVLAGCAAVKQQAVALVRDGELPMPADDKAWSKFLSAIQRSDAKQVREIYMNPNAKGGSAAAGFPDGTVFVMGKNAGWGQEVAEPLKNGNWIYASYLASGQKGPENLGTCRACHAPLTQGKDFVHRYDEHFSQRGASITRAAVFAALHAPADVAGQDLLHVAALMR